MMAAENGNENSHNMTTVEPFEEDVQHSHATAAHDGEPYQPVLEDLGKAFDILPDEAGKDDRPEARYLQEEINWWAEIKRDPLFPFFYYVYNFFIPGLGIFSEGYILFSNGNLKALYRQTWPECWSTFEVCNKSWVESVDYLEIVGILCGQATLGFLADSLGRRKVQIFDAVMMLCGLILITAATGTSLNSWVIMLAWAFFIYGFGVGGEYPTTSSIAAEKAESSAKLMKKRGRTVIFTFALQGWGQLVNVSALLILLLIFNNSGNPPYSASATGATWRVSYALMIPFVVFLIYWRIFRMRENKNYERVKDTIQTGGKGPGGKGDQPGAAHKDSYDGKSFSLMVRYLWPRMVATQFGWFCNDFGFYGSKVFVADFVSISSPGAGVQTTWLWILLQAGVQLVGYYMAALMVDLRWYGRRRMQCIGFMMLFVLYLLVACLYDQLTLPDNVAWYQFIFYLQAFFQQFGPNCTSFLVAAEVYPTPVRATGHGLSAASGKLGALIPQIIFNYTSPNTRFWITCWFNLIGAIATLVFLPDTTGLDLLELDRWWNHMRNHSGAGAGVYKGEAVNPKYLSLWERWVCKYHHHYDPKGDEADEEAEEKEFGDGLGLSMSCSFSRLRHRKHHQTQGSIELSGPNHHQQQHLPAVSLKSAEHEMAHEDDFDLAADQHDCDDAGGNNKLTPGNSRSVKEVGDGVNIK